jgi:hypothetical protein
MGSCWKVIALTHQASSEQRNDLKAGRRSHPGGTLFHRATRIDAMVADSKFEQPPLPVGSGIPAISESQEEPFPSVGSFKFNGGFISA